MNLQIAQDEFRTKINEVYQESIDEQQGFFTSIIGQTKMTSAKSFGIEAQRGYNLVSKDVIRGASANRIQSTKSTQKYFQPPFHNNEVDFTTLDGYDRVFGTAANVDLDTLDRFTEAATRETKVMTNMIKNAIEIQGSEVFDTGIVTMSNGKSIDFNRTAESKPDIGSGDAAKYWNGASADIAGDLNKGAEYIRNVGKSSQTVFDLHLDQTAWEAFRKEITSNETLKPFLDSRHATLLEMQKGRVQQNGATAKAVFGLDAYTFNVWVQTGSYDNDSFASVKYWGAGKAFMYPSDLRTTLNYAGVPTLYKLRGFSNNGNIQNGVFFQKGDIIIDDYTPVTGDAHILRARSAPLYTPISVDRIYSMQVLASA